MIPQMRLQVDSLGIKPVEHDAVAHIIISPRRGIFIGENLLAQQPAPALLISQVVLKQNVPETQREYITNMSLMEIIEQMPEEQRDQVLSEFTKQIEEMNDSIK